VTPCAFLTPALDGHGFLASAVLQATPLLVSLLSISANGYFHVLVLDVNSHISHFLTQYFMNLGSDGGVLFSVLFPRLTVLEEKTCLIIMERFFL
jgi:hypothetical protein